MRRRDECKYQPAKAAAENDPIAPAVLSRFRSERVERAAVEKKSFSSAQHLPDP
jgi:hypothetical protein